MEDLEEETGSLSSFVLRQRSRGCSWRVMVILLASAILPEETGGEWFKPVRPIYTIHYYIKNISGILMI